MIFFQLLKLNYLFLRLFHSFSCLQYKTLLLFLLTVFLRFIYGISLVFSKLLSWFFSQSLLFILLIISLKDFFLFFFFEFSSLCYIYFLQSKLSFFALSILYSNNKLTACFQFLPSFTSSLYFKPLFYLQLLSDLQLNHFLQLSSSRILLVFHCNQFLSISYPQIFSVL